MNPNPILVIYVDDDAKSWIDIPKGKLRIELNGKVIHEDKDGRD